MTAAAVALWGCADSAGGPIPYNVALAPPDAPKIAALQQDYRIAPLDQLTVKVLNVEDLSSDYNVDLAGNISMPLIGEVKAANLTTAQLDQELTQKFGAKYLQDPDVSVAIKASTSRVITVDGSVNKSGAYPTIGSLSLMQAVALAGGVADDANAHRVAVFRQVNGERQAAAFDLAAIRHGQSPDPQVYPGDIVIVDGSSLKQGYKRLVQSMPILAVFRPLML